MNINWFRFLALPKRPNRKPTCHQFIGAAPSQIRTERGGESFHFLTKTNLRLESYSVGDGWADNEFSRLRFLPNPNQLPIP